MNAKHGYPREGCECECHDLGDQCYHCFCSHAAYNESQKAAEPTSGEPPQAWIEAWADKVLGRGNRPCGWPNFGSIGVKEVALMLDAYASECVKRERGEMRGQT